MLLSIQTLLHVTLYTGIPPCYSKHGHCSMLLSIRTLPHVTLYTGIPPCYSKHGHCSMLLSIQTLPHVTLYTDVAPCYSLYGHCPMLLKPHIIEYYRKLQYLKMLDIERTFVVRLPCIANGVDHVAMLNNKLLLCTGFRREGTGVGRRPIPH